MASLALGTNGNVLADSLIRRRSVVTDMVLIVAGMVLVALLAQVSVPLWPVPITGQTLGVIIVGASLGSRRGAASLGLYLAAGVAGLPVFAGFGGGPGSVLSPSFGYIIGFVFAAYVMGWFAERDWDKHFLPGMVGFSLASVIPFLFGVPYMAVVLGHMGYDNSFPAVMQAGVYPFIAGGIVKAAIAAAVIPTAWRASQRLDRDS